MATGSDIQTYLNEIARHPVLSKGAQILHCRRIWAWIHHPDGRDAAPLPIRRAGRRSMDTMLRTNLRLVVSVAKRYQNRGLELPDLIQEGNIGLIRGLELFDPSRGYSVTTYSYWWIRQAITRAIYTYARPIRLPINSYEILHRAYRATNEYLTTHGNPPSRTQLAAIIKVSPERLADILAVQDATLCYSFDQPIPGGDCNFLDLISAGAPPPEDDDDLSLTLTTLLHHLHTHDLFNSTLTALEDREAHIIRAIFLDNTPVRDLAKQYGVTRSRIRQIQCKALQKMRHRISIALPELAA